MSDAPFDAILLVAFGGPERPEEIRPFLESVLRGRPVPEGRIEEVARHYELIGGRSPIGELTRLQRDALAMRLARDGVLLPCEIGMRHAKPHVTDALRALSAAGKRRVLGLIMAAFHDSATVSRYAAAVSDALEAYPELCVEYASGPEEQPGFVRANTEQIEAAYTALPDALRADARLVFTAHSVPAAVGLGSGYVARYEAAAARIAQALSISSYRLAYQSRSGSPGEAWLEPGIGESIRAEAESGARAVVVAPIGFVCDHVEVLYDLDIEAAQVARALGLGFSRASTVNAHPAYIEALARTVRERVGP